MLDTGLVIALAQALPDAAEDRRAELVAEFAGRTANLHSLIDGLHIIDSLSCKADTPDTRAALCDILVQEWEARMQEQPLNVLQTYIRDAVPERLQLVLVRQCEEKRIGDLELLQLLVLTRFSPHSINEVAAEILTEFSQRWGDESDEKLLERCGFGGTMTAVADVLLHWRHSPLVTEADALVAILFRSAA